MPFVPVTRMLILQAEQSLSVTSQNPFFDLWGETQLIDTSQHALQTANLMRVVTPGQQVIRTGKGNRELQGLGVEVHGIVEEGFQIGPRRSADMLPAFFEGVIPTIEPLGQVRDRAPKVGQHPANPGEALYDAAEHELRRG